VKWNFHFSPAAEMEFSFQQTADMKINKIVGRAARPLPLSFKGFR
jgi:hypothetical protein